MMATHSHKTIGLLGGMSWQSTATYYQALNEGTQQSLGGLHSAKILLHSFDFAQIAAMQKSGDWEQLGETMADAAAGLEAAGADTILICTNTMHKLADYVTGRTTIPLLHITDATADQIKAQGFDKVALLGTRFTMEQPFYKDRLKEKHGIDVIIPNEADRQLIHDVIFDELCVGITSAPSRKAYGRIIEDMRKIGAQAVILGCTEIGLLLGETDACLPLLDTTKIHARAALAFAVGH
jgi:amino-acid racemase